MLLRLATVAALLSATLALDNPCKDKMRYGCKDQISSCAQVFPNNGAAPSDKCFDTTDGDYPMTSLCRFTCQTCCLEPQFNCDDAPLKDIDCPGDEASCLLFSDINWEHCRSTCGWCALASKPCVDMAKNCADFKNAPGDLCSNPEVSVQCEMTCGVCISPDCTDNSSRCPVWFANDFCKDPFYTDVKADYCKKTCNLCGPGH